MKIPESQMLIADIQPPSRMLPPQSLPARNPDSRRTGGQDALMADRGDETRIADAVVLGK